MKQKLPKCHILVIDDSDDNLLLLRLLLESETCRVTTVNHPQKGLEQIDRASPDLIILDLMMPCMSGLEVIDCLKAASYSCEIPILLLTANNDFRKSDVQRASAVCHKPFDLDSLLHIVHSLLPTRELKQNTLTC